MGSDLHQLRLAQPTRPVLLVSITADQYVNQIIIMVVYLSTVLISAAGAQQTRERTQSEELEVENIDHLLPNLISVRDHRPH